MPTAKLVMLEAAWSASPQDSRPTTARAALRRAGAGAGPAAVAGASTPSVVIGVRP